MGLFEPLVDVLDGRTLPVGRILDLSKPVMHFPIGTQGLFDWISSLHRPVHRRNPELIDCLDGGHSVGHSLGLLSAKSCQVRIVAGNVARRPVRLRVTNKNEIHTPKVRRWVLGRDGQYDGYVSKDALVQHLKTRSLRTDGPFTLRSGAVSEWYLDARQTTFAGDGAWAVGRAVLEVLDPEVQGVGGMTMGADPIAVATAMVATSENRALCAFSIRKSAKDHGTGGRLVGPVRAGDRVAILEDTTTTGGAALEAADYALEAGLVIVQAIAVVDRSHGVAAEKFGALGIPHVALVTPTDLGVEQ